MDSNTTTVESSVPLVGYLKLDDPPHLSVTVCTDCAAYYFDKRDACASCFGIKFETIAVSTTGTLETFTVVAVAAPGVPVPYVAGVVDCDGISVRANIINVEPSYGSVQLGMPVRLTTFPIGTDDEGTTAIGFGFEPTTEGDDAR
ncbi:MAG: OB-fold domain-containing protein [Mycobacterium sp.]